MRVPMIAGNWKMNKTAAEARQLIKELQEKLPASPAEVVICPPATALWQAAEALKGGRIRLGAQNLHWESAGAFTGELSAGMLKEAGVELVIIGHSERRQYFGETDETVNKRLKAALAAGLTPIVCVGETLTEREAQKTTAVIERQLRQGLVGLTPQELSRCVIAYEPVWAIGTGKTATPEQAQEVHAFARTLLGELSSGEVAAGMRILYGGSVNAANAKVLLGQADIDGALVGGASLKAGDFATIVAACS